MLLRLEYDDNTLDIMDKVNTVLEKVGYTFVCDNLAHDGFEIYNLERTEKGIK
jgi:hypothetical protein